MFHSGSNRKSPKGLSQESDLISFAVSEGHPYCFERTRQMTMMVAAVVSRAQMRFGGVQISIVWVGMERRDTEMQGTPQRGTITRWFPANQREGRHQDLGCWLLA